MFDPTNDLCLTFRLRPRPIKEVFNSDAFNDLLFLEEFIILLLLFFFFFLNHFSCIVLKRHHCQFLENNVIFQCVSILFIQNIYIYFLQQEVNSKAALGSVNTPAHRCPSSTGLVALDKAPRMTARRGGSEYCRPGTPDAAPSLLLD